MDIKYKKSLIKGTLKNLNKQHNPFSEVINILLFKIDK